MLFRDSISVLAILTCGILTTVSVAKSEPESLGVDQSAPSTIENVLLQSPVIGLLPDAHSKPELNPPTLRWPSGLGPGPYTITLNRDGDPPGHSLDFTAIRETFLRPARPLEPGTWHWHVTTVDGSRSVTASFTLDASLPRWEIPPWETLMDRLPKGRPRIYMRSEELPRLHSLIDGPYREFLRSETKKLQKKTIGQEIPELPERSKKWFGQIEKAYVNGPIRRLVPLSFLYNLTSDENLAREIRRRTLHYAQFTPDELAHPDRNDFANSWVAASLATAYDALYDQWTPEERKALAAAILERMRLGGREFQRGALHDQEQINSGAHAWQWVIRNLTIGALALYDEYPEAREFFEWSLKLHVALYPWWGGASGGSAEGASYFKGTGTVSALETAALFRSSVGLDFFRKPWYQNALWYLLYTQGLGQGVSQFGDNVGPEVMPEKGYRFAHVFAGRNEQPFFTSYWEALRDRYSGQYTTEDWMTLFLAPYHFAPPEPLEHLPKARVFRDIGLVTMRSDLPHPDRDILFEFRSSPYGSVDHNHADQNSFNINAYGSPLIIDSGYYDSYGSPHHTQWTTLTKAHNTILVDHTGMPRRSLESFGQITHFEIGDGLVRTSGSAAKGYKEAGVRKFDRHILWLEPDTYLIVDLLETGQPATFQWLLHTPTEAKVEGRVLTITNGKAQARVRFFAPENLQITQTDRFEVAPTTLTPAKAEFLKTPNQWHLTASTVEPADHQQFVTVIQVAPQGETSSLPEPTVIIKAGEAILTLPDGRRGTLSWK